MIKNKEALSRDKKSRDILEIVEAGLVAIDARTAIGERIRLDNNDLLIDKNRWPLPTGGKIWLVGLGKVAWAAAMVVGDVLGDRIEQGLVLGTHESRRGQIVGIKASHPMPTSENVEATKKVLEMLSKVKEEDVVIVIVTGGGSAMMTLPNGRVEDMVEMTKSLFRVGANIEEINTIRKHVDLVKGGGLLRYTNNAKVLSLLFSDVPGDELGTIASGPSVFDPSGIEEAREVLKKYGLEEMENNLKLVETPKDKTLFDRVTNLLVVNKDIAIKAMVTKSRSLGYETDVMAEYVEGEARETGERLINRLAPGKVVMAAGETTVTVKGGGKGGRNQELVLGTLAKLKPSQVIVSVASDGKDLTDWAGALGSVETLERARVKNLDPNLYLAENNSSEFFEKVEGVIDTSLLDSNVADLMVALEERP